MERSREGRGGRKSGRVVELEVSIDRFLNAPLSERELGEIELTLSSLTVPRRGSAASCVPVFFMSPALNSNSVKSSQSCSFASIMATERTEQVHGAHNEEKKLEKKTE